MLLSKKWIWRVFVTGLCAWTMPVFAEESSLPSEPVTVLDTVVVTAGRIKEQKEDVTTNITVVNEAQIKQSGARDLGELLADQGFMTRVYSNSLVSVSMRGFRTDTHGNDLSSHVLILIDGRRAGTGDLSKIMVDNVERVEIIRGPGSVQYGASAMGGVINVITREGTKKLSIQAEGTLGSWDYEKGAASISGKVKNIDFSFSGSRESQDDYRTAHGDRYDNTGFDRKERISLSAGWTFTPSHRIGAIFTRYEGEGIGSPDYFSENDPDDYVDDDIYSIDFIYDGQTSDTFLAWKLRYFQGKDEHEIFDPEISAHTPTYTRDTDHQGCQAQVTAKWSQTHLTAGFDWTHYEIENTYSDGENEYDNPAFLLMTKTRLMDEKLVLSFGGRYDQYEVESDDGRSTDETNWSSSFGLAYKMTPKLSIRANYAEAFRMPTADELYMFDDYSEWGFGIWSGNPDLDPEESQTYEIGVDFSNETFSASLTGFYTAFDDKIDYTYNPVTNITIYENIDGATISGIETTFQCNMGAWFNWPWEVRPYGTVTYLIDYENDDDHTDLLYTPQWTTGYGLRCVNTDLGVSCRLNFIYVSDQDIIDYEETGETSLDGHTTADLSISKSIFTMDKSGELSVKIDVRNLFDKQYALVQGYPMPGRSIYAGLKYVY